MKKFMKALAVFAAMAMLAGSFVSCSSDDDSSGSKPAATKYKCDGCGTEYGTEAEKNNCAKQAGCPKYVAPGAQPVNIVFNTLTDADKTALGLTYASNLFSVEAASSGKDATLSNGSKLHWKGSKPGSFRLRSTSEDLSTVSSVNYNGGFQAVGSIGAVGSTLTNASTTDRYISVPVVAGTTYTYSIPAKVTVVASKDLAAADKDTSWKGRMGIVDGSDKVLAFNEFEMNGRYYDDSKDSSNAADAITGAASAADKSPTLTGTFTATDNEVRIVFSREGAKKSSGSSGGFDVISITLTPAAN